MQYVEFFTEGTPNPDLLGGKGSNLVKLVEIKANIPPGFIINTNGYKKFLEESEYRDQLIGLLSNNIIPKDILNHSKKIKELALASKLPREIINEIRVAFDKICKEFDDKLNLPSDLQLPLKIQINSPLLGKQTLIYVITLLMKY